LNKVLVFTDEYHYESNGLFNAYMQQSQALSSKFKITAVLNKQHWGLGELYVKSQDLPNFNIEVLDISQPGKLCFNLAEKIKSFLISGLLRVLGGVLDGIMLPFVYWRLFVFLKELEFDLVLIHNGGWPGGYLSRALALVTKLTKKPVVMVIHNYPSKSKSNSFNYLVFSVRYLQNLVANVCVNEFVAVSNNLSKSLKDFGLKRVRTIFNSFDHTKVTNFPNNRSLRADNTVVVGFIGALIPRKGVDVLLKGFLELSSDSELLIVGDGVERSALEVIANNSERKITFAGFSNEPLIQLNMMDILVVPSIAFESFGMVILEGMAAKLPVVVSEIGGMPEVIVNGVTGYLFPPGDHHRLSQVLEILVGSPDLRESMGANGYTRLIEEFSVNKMNLSYIEMVDELIVTKI